MQAVPQYQLSSGIGPGGVSATSSPGNSATSGNNIDPNSTLGDLQTGIGVAGNLYSLLNSIQLNNSALTNLNQSNPFGAYRSIYGNDLLNLIQNPSSLVNQPGYQFELGQGVQALDRSAAAPGGVGFGSGAEGAELLKFGEGLASQFYNQQTSLLAQLAGANIAPANAAQMLQAAGGAASGMGSSITGLSSSTANLLAKLYPNLATSNSNPQSTPGTYDPTNSVFTGQPGQTSVDWGMGGGGPTDPTATTGDPNTSLWSDPNQGLDLSGLYTGPKTAGGEAATTGGQPSTGMTFGRGVGSAVDMLNIIQGVKQGGVAGYGGAALSATDLYGKATGTNIPYVGEAGDILGIYTGIKKGGVAGYGQAAVDAMQLADVPGVGYVAAPVAAYEALNNYGGFQKNQYAHDIATDAAAGAAIGSIIPGVGTLIGAGAGALVGAVGAYFGPKAEDALFPGVEQGLHGNIGESLTQTTEAALLGPGANLWLNHQSDPETKNWQGFINATGGANANAAQVQAITKGMPPQVAFNLLSGVMDIKDDRIPIVNAFGRMGESALLNQMTSQINSAIKSGQISASASPDQIFSQIVTPWLNSRGATITPETGGLQLQGVLTSLIGAWQSGQLTSSTVLTSGGSKDLSLPTFGG